MSDRFASLKSNNTFKKSNDKRTPPPQKTNSRFDNLNEKKSNRFSYKSKDRRFNNRRDNRRDNRIDNRIDNRSNNFPGNIGKFTQVGTGEVSFVPQIKCGSNSQKDRKKEREMKKMKVINKKNKDEECYSLQTDEDIAVTLAMAQQYQYFTESDEEVEEGENNEVENTDTTDFDNSAW